MKRKIFILMTAVMVFGLAIAVYAYNASTTGDNSAVSSCCKGDSCPMKMKSSAAAEDEKKSCCDCCKDGSCSMKAHKEGAAHGAGHEMKDGESCPMKMGEHKMKGMKHEAAAEKHECGCGCACCGGKEKKDGEAAV